MDSKEAGDVLVNLGQMPDEVISFILKRVPAKDLLKACTQVSRQWHRILSQKFFWKEKLEMDGFFLPWRSGQSLNFYKRMAIKQPFRRNFIRDSWDLTRQDRNCCQLDGRWNINQEIVWQKDGDQIGHEQIGIEVPPVFSHQQPEMGPELGGEPVLACLATNSYGFIKWINIRLADEGLTNELMDIYRPTIVVSELVAANRLGHEGDTEYRMYCYLSPDRSVGSCRKQFQRGEAHSWNLLRHEFKQYAAGMRYLTLQVIAQSVKLARCSVMALCESNALKADEAVQSRG